MEIHVTGQSLKEAKEGLAIAKNSYDVVDKKHQKLRRKLAEAEKTVAEIRQKLETLEAHAKKAQSLARLGMGEQRFHKLLEEESPLLVLGKTCVAFDIARQAWLQVLQERQKLAEFQEIFAALAAACNRAGKRAAALKHVTIPELEARIKYIAEQLEERERDEMVRVRYFVS